MSDTNKMGEGGSAFPQHGWSSNPEVLERMKNQGGMSLRDWFAGQALAAIPHVGCGSDLTLKEIAGEAYNIADAMIAARRTE